MFTRRPSDAMMPQTISTRRKVATTDSGGSTSWTDTPVLTGIRASVQAQPTPVGLVAGSSQEIKVWQIYVDSEQDIKPFDLIDNPDGTGGTAEIVAVQDLSGRLSVTMLVAEMRRTVGV